MRWSVYKIERYSALGRTRKAVPLGYVNAADSPRALDAACKRWPKHRDSTQTQEGFSVRPYATDHMGLGKLHGVQS